MSGGDNQPPRDDFDARLRAAQSAQRERSGKSKDSGEIAPSTGMQGAGFALRVGTELVAATIVGLAIGYGLDYWLGTGPWLMIVFVFFGGAAGVSNVYRLAIGMDQGVGWRRPDDPDDPDQNGDGKG